MELIGKNIFRNPLHLSNFSNNSVIPIIKSKNLLNSVIISKDKNHQINPPH